MSEEGPKFTNSESDNDNSRVLLPLFLDNSKLIKNIIIYKFPNFSKDYSNRQKDIITIKKTNFDNPNAYFDLRNINTSDLENLEAQRRTDEFITQHISEIRRVAMSPADRRKRFMSSSGLIADPNKSDPSEVITVGNNAVIPLGEIVTNIDFMPGGRTSKDPTMLTQSLAAGINGIVELLDAIDHGRNELPSVFVGHTNINMALIAQRIGFEITDQCRDQNGNIDRERTRFTVVGKLDNIRAKVEQFKQSAKYVRLQKRASKLGSSVIPKPRLSPVG